MGKKAAKSARKFAASGQLKKTIDARRKHQQIKKKADRRQQKRHTANGNSKSRHEAEEDDENEDSRAAPGKASSKAGKSKSGPMTVDDFLGASFMEEEDDEVDGSSEEDSDDDDEVDDDDDESLASLGDIDEGGEEHILELSKLAEKDPDFYKYLQENDPELLEFQNEAQNDEDEDEDIAMSGPASSGPPVLTKDVLRKWQKALLEHRSLRALRKLLVAFRAAAYVNEEDQVLAWTIDSPAVHNKLMTTTLRYTPVVLAHHVPYRTLPNGKFKPPSQTSKLKSLNKMILSYFYNIIHLMDQLMEPEMVQLALAESTKLVPYIIGSRKAVKSYLKCCLRVWSSAEDGPRISAFLAMQKLASSTDQSVLDLVLKGLYLTLVRTCSTTTAHNLPSINLMKNTASEIYCIDHDAAYQHTFGYIRQLAIHLRDSIKTKTKESYKLVYNWQYAHSVDFWCLVIGRACDIKLNDVSSETDSALKTLIYPLVQVTLGAIKLVTAPRSFPFHLHLTRSLLHLTRHTHTYVPLATCLLPIVNYALSPNQPKKSSTLKPLGLDTHIRAPQQYLKTRVFAEELVEETVFSLAEWLASRPQQNSIAFPELIVPITVTLRKVLKEANKHGSKGRNMAKEAGMVKGLLESVEESSHWIEQRRKGVKFSPVDVAEVERWQTKVQIDESPLSKYLKVQRKAREKRRALIETARRDEDNIISE